MPELKKIEMTYQNETWQVDVGGQIYETNFEGLVNWIAEGSLLRGDKIRRGNLRWLEAGKIPMLLGFFNAKETGQPMPPFQFSTTDAENTGENQTHSAENFASTQNFSSNQPPANNFAPTDNFNSFTGHQNFQPAGFENPQPQNFCLVHTETPPDYVCESCLNVYCKECPSSYGGTVKICPMCGSMCKPLEKFEREQSQIVQYNYDIGRGFGFSDFGNALAYPFKYKASLIFGAIMFMFFTIGQSASGTGSFFLIGAAITCFMCSNMLTFGIMANVVENFSQGKIGGNFMPSFDDFNIWDDVVHPFFLSIGVYLVSFGLMFVLIIGAAWAMWNTITSSMTQTVQTQMPNGAESARQLPQIRQMSNRLNENNLYRDGEMPDERGIANTQNGAINREEQEFQDLQKMIDNSRKAELESVAGKTPEAEAAQMNGMISSLLTTAGIFVIPIILAFLWGVFYLPAACAVAGYTRSFAATINPSVGLDTIKRLGFDYVKILGMFLLLMIASGIVSVILNIIFFPFNLPRMGNLPAIAVGSWFTFYISIVFSLILGYALYKNSEKMNLFRN